MDNNIYKINSAAKQIQNSEFGIVQGVDIVSPKTTQNIIAQRNKHWDIKIIIILLSRWKNDSHGTNLNDDSNGRTPSDFIFILFVLFIVFNAFKSTINRLETWILYIII